MSTILHLLRVFIRRVKILQRQILQKFSITVKLLKTPTFFISNFILNLSYLRSKSPKLTATSLARAGLHRWRLHSFKIYITWILKFTLINGRYMVILSVLLETRWFKKNQFNIVLSHSAHLTSDWLIHYNFTIPNTGYLLKFPLTSFMLIVFDIFDKCLSVD